MRRQLRRVAAFLVLLMVGTVSLLAQSETVYVTKTGAKYHRSGCNSLRSSSIPMSLSQASARYGACLNCKPPIPTASSTATPAEGTAKAAPAQRAVTGGRCQATTKKATQCSRKAKAGSSYCWQHGGTQ
jgi:hypothetical protein